MKTKIVTDQYPLFLPESLTPRSKGVHVSSIIRCIAIETGILSTQNQDDLSLSDVRTITDEDAILRINIGLAWEEHYIGQILSRYGVIDHPGEMQYDGVYLSHDGEDLSVILTVPVLQYGPRVHEVKATYKSTKTVGDLSSQWMWITQMKAYCIARGCTTAFLHALFLCGNYVAPIRPVLKIWELEFTQRELDENWELLSQYKKERMEIESRVSVSMLPQLNSPEIVE